MTKKRVVRELDAALVRAALDYDAATGLLFWKVRADVPRKVNKRWAGKPAGGLDGQYGYLSVRLYGGLYQAHRLIWLHVHGEWPPAVLDHVDGNPTNNRLENLRPATRAENNRNRAASRAGHLKGTTFDKRSRRWIGQIMIGRRNHCLGTFDTAEEAHAAYCEAAKRMHGAFARTS